MVLESLAYSLNRRDEEPNIRLAETIAVSKNKSQVKELFALLEHKNKSISSDAIKVIDEIALRNPTLIQGHVPDLIILLSSKNNRLQWGAMAALDNVSVSEPDQIYRHLNTIITAANHGSVITRDRCVALLIKLVTHKKHAADAVPLLMEILLKAPDNQFAMYAENIGPVLKKDEHRTFEKILHERLPDLPKDSQIKRIKSVLAKLKAVKP